MPLSLRRCSTLAVFRPSRIAAPHSLPPRILEAMLGARKDVVLQQYLARILEQVERRAPLHLLFAPAPLEESVPGCFRPRHTVEVQAQRMCL